MLLSLNRVHHLFVVNKIAEATDLDGNHLKDTAAVGTIHVRTTKEGEFYFEYMSPGGVINSDYVNAKRVLSSSVRDGLKDCRQLAARVLKFKDFKGAGNDASGILKSQNVPGQTLNITVELGGYLGLDEMDKRICQASVYMSNENTSNSDLYARLAHSLALNIASMPDPMLRIVLLTGDDDSTGTEIEIKNCRVKTKLATLLASGDTYKGILLRERIDPIYVQGKGEELPLTITVTSRRIAYSEHDVVWLDDSAATITDNIYGVKGVTAATAEKMPNGRRTADLEYWLMGERGDQERHYGWPNNVDTQYLAKPEQVYDYLTVHFYWAGSHEEVQKSERDLTIVTPHFSDLTAGTASGLLNSVVAKFNATKLITFDTI